MLLLWATLKKAFSDYISGLVTVYFIRRVWVNITWFELYSWSHYNMTALRHNMGKSVQHKEEIYKTDLTLALSGTSGLNFSCKFMLPILKYENAHSVT